MTDKFPFAAVCLALFNDILAGAFADDPLEVSGLSLTSTPLDGYPKL